MAPYQIETPRPQDGVALCASGGPLCRLPLMLQATPILGGGVSQIGRGPSAISSSIMRYKVEQFWAKMGSNCPFA